ncbi:MAG TPA: DEAD/DEAH box helicase [Candidatus Limnocylindria bacterium]|nr:DEAD/DEAH box helicase [Candidatus Limnocylindria bacterium]
MSFDRLGLTPDLMRAVAQQGYTEPTPIQREAIPLVLDGRDVLAGAQTGTGKTAAFVLPILQRLNGAANNGSSGRRAVRALILTPTRELCLQIEESVRVYGGQRPVSSAAIYGGVDFDKQVRRLIQGAQIVVATPGRLLDHVGQRTIDLSRVEVLVLDEADRMLDMGFIPDVRRILALLPSQRQNLLFSATLSPEIKRLASDFLDRPISVQVAPKDTPAELVRQLVMPVERARKRELLSWLIDEGRIEQALVFTRTKHGASRLAQQLERDGHSVTAIHGDKNQAQRVRALEDLKRGRVDILVATDVAARGLDIDALPHVVNYELPSVPSDYVHRIGRTGRAGADGDAVSLVSAEERPLLEGIEKMLGHRLEVEVIEGFEPAFSMRSEGPRAAARGYGSQQGPERRRRSGGRRGGRPSGGQPAQRQPAPRQPAAGGQPPQRQSAPRQSAPRETAGGAAGQVRTTLPGERFARAS